MSEFGQCKGCRHWKLLRFRDDWGTREQIDNARLFVQVSLDAPAGLEDEIRSITYWTAPTFVCAEFEPLEGEIVDE